MNTFNSMSQFINTSSNLITLSNTYYSTNFVGMPTGFLTTPFSGWTPAKTGDTSLYSHPTYGSGYLDPRQNENASGRCVIFLKNGTNGIANLSRTNYLLSGYTYTLSFYYGTRQSGYYETGHYIEVTITNQTNNSTPNPICNVTGSQTTETLQVFTFTVPTSGNYIMKFAAGSLNAVTDSSIIIRNIQIS